MIERSFDIIDAYPMSDLMGHLARFNRGDEPMFVIANVPRAPRLSHEFEKIGLQSIHAVLVLTTSGQLGWVDDVKLEVMSQ